MLRGSPIKYVTRDIVKHVVCSVKSDILIDENFRMMR